MSEELILVDPLNYDINLFDMDAGSIKPGREGGTFYGTLTYDGKVPFFLAEGDTYGIQKAQSQKEREEAKNKTPKLPSAIVQLPSAIEAAGDNEEKEAKRDKWQVAIRLSAQPAQNDWTEPESKLIDFIDNGIRKILAHVLAKRVDILNKIGSNVITDAQERFRAEMLDPTIAAKYPDQAAQMARFQQIIVDILPGKVSRKVYRKKKDKKESVPMNLMDAGAAYDETKYPTLYSTIQSIRDKQSNKEVFLTKYYKFVDGVPENEWPTLSHEEAIDLGWYRDNVANRFDSVFFGTSISPQIKAAEIVFLKAIGGSMGHKGRLIHAAPEIPRNSRLVTRSAIQPAGAPMSPVASLQQQAEAVASVPAVVAANPAPVSSSPAEITGAPAAFDPSALAGVPGITAAPPTVVSHVN